MKNKIKKKTENKQNLTNKDTNSTPQVYVLFYFLFVVFYFIF